MKKVVRMLVLFLGINFCFVSAVQASGEPILVFVNGYQVIYNQLPIIEEGYTLVQFRPSFEALGFQIQWDEEHAIVTGKAPNTKLELQLDSKTAYVNGEARELEIAPRMVNGSVYVPIRFLGESTGGDVAWDPKTNHVDIITDKGYYVYMEVIRNDFEKVKYWLDHGGGANFANNNDGISAIDMAVHHKNAKMVKLLLDYGANPDMLNPVYPKVAILALDMAIYYKSPDIVKLLIQYGAEPDRVNKEGKTRIENLTKDIQQEKNPENIELTKQILTILENENDIPRVDRYSRFIAQGPSMEPTAFDNERVLLYKKYYLTNPVSRNDLIVFEGPNGKMYMKRVVGIPRETLEINGENLYINGERLTSIMFPDNQINSSEIELNENQVFVIGDNYNDSLDSRSTFLGPISLDKIIGKVIHVEHLHNP